MAKCAERLPLHRLAKMFPLHGIDIPDQTMCGCVAQCAELLEPLYGGLKRYVLESKMATTITGLTVSLPAIMVETQSFSRKSLLAATPSSPVTNGNERANWRCPD